MSDVAKRLHDLLDESGVDYEIIHHKPDYRAEQTALDTHTPPKDFAKTVVLWIDGQYALAALPADHTVSERKLRRSIGAEDVRLAAEWEMEDLCPDCEIGAAPPFGVLYGLPTYVCPLLAEDEQITFNAGTHRDAVRMSWQDFERLVKPRVASMSKHEDPHSPS